jgi:hypothetical protein
MRRDLCGARGLMMKEVSLATWSQKSGWILSVILATVPVLSRLPSYGQSQLPNLGGADPAKKRVVLTKEFWSEGAAVADFNKDGIMDVAYGPKWWQGPDFSVSHDIYSADKSFEVKQSDGSTQVIRGFKGMLSGENAYSDNFLSFAHDFNGDGYPDYYVVDIPGKDNRWYENPGKSGGVWKKHLVMDVVDNESPSLVDINGDGRPDLLCTTGGYLGYATYNPKALDDKWTWHAVSEKGKWHKYTHGLGAGDINGDGRVDILDATGWWEQPASLEGDPVWKCHPAIFGQGGAQMLVMDVNGDGLNDVVTSLMAHGYGVAWFEQTRDGEERGWRKHLIVGAKADETAHGTVFSQPHAMALGDMNGDGLLDLVTGKRFWAHGPKGDPEPNAAPVLFWFELKRDGKGGAHFIPHLIDDDSGVGTQITVADMNGDGKLDVISGNKRGASVFLR